MPGLGLAAAIACSSSIIKRERAMGTSMSLEANANFSNTCSKSGGIIGAHLAVLLYQLGLVSHLPRDGVEPEKK
jgi:hypothetical protein